MERKYPTDELLITRPWVVVSDESATKKLTPIDMLELDIKNIWSLLGEMIGETYEEELIDQIFSQFCLGK